MTDDAPAAPPRIAARFTTAAVAAAMWVLGTLLWALAATGGGTLSMGEALPIGATQMGAATLLGLGVWWLTGAVPRSPWYRVGAAHGPALVLFAALYTLAPAFLLFKDATLLGTVRHAFTAATTGWNLLIGSFLYVAIAGVGHARRTERSLRESERARAAERLAVRDAQLAALAAQLQPHFLFNALHTVGALVHADADRADQALDELGRLLRYALREPGDTVSLREEWQFARDYLAFEGLRLGERMRLDLTVADDALTVRVPPLLLQPLLENAVRHGVAAHPDGGAIAVTIARIPGAVRVEVRNTVPSGGPSAPGMAGSGLRRLAERLALTYGDRASIRTAPEPGGYRVTLILPDEDLA